MVELCTLLTENFSHPAEVYQHASTVFVKTPYHEEIKTALKAFDRARWAASEEAWSFPATPRNVWSLKAMTEGGPFDRYLDEIADWHPEGKKRFNSDLDRLCEIFERQRAMVGFALSRLQCIIAAEMRTGKTWAYIEIMETHPDWEWWFVAPVKVQAEIRRQLKSWGCKVQPRLINYSELKKIIERSKSTIPRGVIYDEGSFLKGNSKRALAATQLAIRMDTQWGEENCIRVLGTGTPQPHSYLDWWHLCEAVRPGFLPWGNMFVFQQFLEVREQKQGLYGNKFWERVQWKDGSACVKCVGTGTDPLGGMVCPFCEGKKFIPNNVAKLEKILSNIVLIVLKKEVVELPDKEFIAYTGDPRLKTKPGDVLQMQYDARLTPTPAMMNVAKSIAASGLSTIEIMSKHRQLSDGFQYQFEKVTVKDKHGDEHIRKKQLPTIRGKTPKDIVTRELLAKHEETGRFVIYAAYTEAIDHLCELAEAEGWKVLRCDGKYGWKTWKKGLSAEDALSLFASKSFTDKIVAIGHPQSMGYGLDLAGSCGFLFYSMDFNEETFEQAMERGHSINMDVRLGCTLYFFIILPTDKLVIDNLLAKKRVQDITKGSIKRLYEGQGSERN